ncbi:leucine-rich repeat domain-containing protein [Ascoidea rubescens DSM 1968]|uniref:L domain-like protein n=1 Tax=Ascoidea rubescens DSM 1968 TaxID=1344418 RepID=A0A1D2VNG1_9ASCO|nr:L domain-like protein [Ascoidea rubescens DSM 1968]ODV63143.1 L domain-like protein [Ascoidea rubescens DSM 1968]
MSRLSDCSIDEGRNHKIRKLISNYQNHTSHNLTKDSNHDDSDDDVKGDGNLIEPNTPKKKKTFITDLPFYFIKKILSCLGFDKLLLFTLHDNKFIRDFSLKIVFLSVVLVKIDKTKNDASTNSKKCFRPNQKQVNLENLWIDISHISLFTSQLAYTRCLIINLQIKHALIYFPNLKSILSLGLNLKKIVIKIRDLSDKSLAENISDLFNDLALYNSTSLDSIEFSLQKNKDFQAPSTFISSSYFSNLVNLKDLNLSSNNVFKFNVISNLLRLKRLDLSNSNLTKTQNINNLINLEELNLSSNKIEKIDMMPYLISLKVLNLSYNNIKKIENLWDLFNLEVLNLSWNSIEKIENLSNLTHLTHLNLSVNHINKMENVSALVSLVEIDLSLNNIQEIEDSSILDKIKLINSENNIALYINQMQDLLR